MLLAYAIGDLVRSPLLDDGLSAEAIHNAALVVAYGLMAGFIATRFFRWESRA